MKKIVLIVLIVLVMVTSACTKDEIQSTGSEAVQSLTTGRTSIENSVIEFVQETGNCDTSVWPNNCQ